MRRRLHRAEDLQIARDLSRAVERGADRPGVRAALREARAIGAARADRVGERLRVARLHDEAAVVRRRNRRDLARLLHRRDVRPPRGENAVELARHDVARQASLQRDDEDVGGRERLAELRLGHERQEEDVLEPEALRALLERRLSSRRRLETPAARPARRARARPHRRASRGSATTRDCPSASRRTCRRDRAPPKTRCAGGQAESADVSAQFEMTTVRSGDAPLFSISRRRIVSPIAMLRAARRTRNVFTAWSAPLIVSLWKSSSSTVTSGNTSWNAITSGARNRRPASHAARPMIGGSVSATTTSGLSSRRPA